MIKSRLNQLLLLVGALLASDAAAAPVLQFSQDGKTYVPFSMIEGNSTANEYYDHRKASGNPAFGLARATTSVGIYWDDTRNLMSLMLVTGSKGSVNKRDKGSISLNISSLPKTAYPMLSDDPGEFRYRKTRANATARFHYQDKSDGFVIGGLEKKTWIIKIAVISRQNAKALRLVDGDVNDDGDFIDLVLSRPLWLKWGNVPNQDPEPPVVPPTNGGSGGTPTTPTVPEPGAAMLLATAGVLLARRRR